MHMWKDVKLFLAFDPRGSNGQQESNSDETPMFYTEYEALNRERRDSIFTLISVILLHTKNQTHKLPVSGRTFSRYWAGFFFRGIKVYSKVVLVLEVCVCLSQLTASEFAL